jgi:hypothetical protein
VSVAPCLWTFASSWSTSVHLDLATTCNKMRAVAAAHCSAPFICLRLRRLCQVLI